MLTAEVGVAGFNDDAPLALSPAAAEDLLRRLRDGSDRDLFDAVAAVGCCSRPIRLVGHAVTVDTATGAVVDQVRSVDLPLGAAFIRCGNRRESVCPSCSRVYARDTFELIRAGIQGGKTVPASVADNPLLFVTLTAPSFGAVHRADREHRACRPRQRTQWCVHGVQMACSSQHDPEDPCVGAPLCPDCYDWRSAVVWQFYAPELWRRFTIALRREIAHRLGVKDAGLKLVASVQYAKVAEYQARGMVHFHALIRLDGPARQGIGAPAPLGAADVAEAIKAATAGTEYTAPAVDDDDGVARRLTWGRQVDVRIVREAHRTDDPAEPITPGQVAGYLAKYATKDASHLGDGVRLPRPHLARLRSTCRELFERGLAADGVDSPYLLLGKWAHMLGFRGHFATKSRRYSITLSALRRARRRWQALAVQSRRTGKPIDLTNLEARLLATEDEQGATLVIGSWAYAGTGWDTDGDRELAIAAANRAREWEQWRASQRHQRITKTQRGEKI